MFLQINLMLLNLVIVYLVIIHVKHATKRRRNAKLVKNPTKDICIKSKKVVYVKIRTSMLETQNAKVNLFILNIVFDRM